MNNKPLNQPQITWSLMHWTPIEVEYFKKILNQANKYEVNSFEICGQYNIPYDGLDGLITYQEYPVTYSNRNNNKIIENQKNSFWNVKS